MVDIEQQFLAMFNGVGINKFACVNTQESNPRVNDITGVADVTLGDWKLEIDGYMEGVALKVSTQKLLSFLIIKLTESNNYRGKGEVNTEVRISLKEYIGMCGVPDTKPSRDKMRRKVQADLEVLFRCRMTWKEKYGKNFRDFSALRLISAKKINRGIICVDFYKKIAEYLVGAYIMKFPQWLFRVDERNPSTFIIGRKLALHYGIDQNRVKGTYNKISVKALLAECSHTIPSYDEVINNDRHVRERIIKPLEGTLNALVALGGITWEYCNAGGVPLTNAQLKCFTYRDFENLYIKFEVKGFPDQTARIENRTENSMAEKEN